MNTGNLEARPLQTPQFKQYCADLARAQQHPCQVERARLYRAAWVRYNPESAGLVAEYESGL